jgi:glutathione-regulated potassium-efflux system ancillary protein KefC
MTPDLVMTYLVVIFASGLVAYLVRLPPLIGFLAAGFILNGMGVPEIASLEMLADAGVALMLFAIGLRLDLRTLLGREVWLSAGLNMLLTVVIGGGMLYMLAIVGAIRSESLGVLAMLALVLSFSSTIFVVKILQDRGDEQSLYGRISIGVLIMQDVVAVVVISVSSGTVPSAWALGLIVLIPLLAWIARDWHRLGHGEMSALFGLVMALIPGYALFEKVGLSGSLGALIMGMALAPTVGSDELSHTLFTLKELLLVAFFVSIGFQGMPTFVDVKAGLFLMLLLPVETVLYWVVLWGLGLRNRTSVLTSLVLANFSEFALIVAAIGVESGWLAEEWLMSLVVAIAGSFVLASFINPRNLSTISNFAARLPARPPHKLHPEDRPINIGEANAAVLGMGRVGRACYAQLRDEHKYKVVGVEHDPARVQKLRHDGYFVVEGDATDSDFWERVIRTGRVSIIILAMPSQHANIDALTQLRRLGNYTGTIAAVAAYAEDVAELHDLGLDVVVHVYSGAGTALADSSVQAALEKLPPDDDDS